MRFFYSLVGVFALFLIFLPTVHASSASLEALGNPLLVAEEESTLSSIFNLGNPAGLVFMPNQTRLDFNITADYMSDFHKFNTYPRKITAVAVPHIDPNGSTVAANSWYAQNSYLFSSRLNNEDDYQWSGLIFRPVNNVTVQLIPLANFNHHSYDEDLAPSRQVNGGLKARSALRLSNNLSLGAGVRYDSGKEDGWQKNVIESLISGSVTNQLLSYENMSAEFGTNWRSKNVFDDNDLLDVGFLVKATQTKITGDLTFDSRLIASVDNDPMVSSTTTAIPWSASLLSAYRYKDVMDISLEYGYEEAKDYVNWTSGYYGSQDVFVANTLSNLFYELAFRVRLPMVREDDLRFGVAFNNKGFGNQYHTGLIQSDNPNQLERVADINTSSSSIAIETGFVPYDGSIISLKYHLGSSKSQQSKTIIDDYGYTEFALGAKFKLLDWLTLSSSYSNLRQSTESTEGVFSEELNVDSSGNTTYVNYVSYNPVIKTQETNTLRFGVGVHTDTWDLGLSTAAYRITYSPTGWLYRPNNVEIDVEEIFGYSSMLSFVYRY